MRAMILVLLLATAAHAQPVIQSWHITTTGSTIAWDSPHTGPEYSHIVWALATHERDDVSKKVKLAEVPGATLQADVAYPGAVSEGLYYLGVQTIFHPNFTDYPDVVQESDIAWSQNATVVQGGATFGAFFAPVLAPSSNLRLVSQPPAP